MITKLSELGGFRGQSGAQVPSLSRRPAASVHSRSIYVLYHSAHPGTKISIFRPHFRHRTSTETLRARHSNGVPYFSIRRSSASISAGRNRAVPSFSRKQGSKKLQFCMHELVISYIHLYTYYNELLLQELQVCTGDLGHPSELYAGDPGARL